MSVRDFSEVLVHPINTVKGYQTAASKRLDEDAEDLIGK